MNENRLVKGWKSLSVREDLLEQIKQWAKSEGVDIDGREFTGWINDVLLKIVTKENWLKQFTPHLTYVSKTKNSMLIRDKHLDNKVVEVEYKDNRFWCSDCKPRPCPHVFFTVANRRVGELEDNERDNNKHD